jgi:hypothetical protein
LLSDEGKYHLMGQKLKAQRISKRSEAKEENSKVARFQELDGSESEYPSAYSKPPIEIRCSAVRTAHIPY